MEDAAVERIRLREYTGAQALKAIRRRLRGHALPHMFPGKAAEGEWLVLAFGRPRRPKVHSASY